MAEITLVLEPEVVTIPLPDVSQIITEDDTPVDNLFSAKQQRLLVESLYTSWQIDRPFVADANVGIYNVPRDPAIVPDVFLSLDVAIAEDWYAKEHRTYFIWEFGKPPDVVIEIVSNNKGGELDRKLRAYARLRVWYYVVYDPQRLLQDEPLQVYELRLNKYVPKSDAFLDSLDLGLTLWTGVYENKEGEWLRWHDAQGALLPTGAELSALERQRAEQERQRAEQERQRAERLAAQLRALGVDPEL